MRKTSNPVFTEGKTLHGTLPTMPRTDSVFDKPYNAEEHIKEEEKRQAEGMAHGQRQNKPEGKAPRVTQPGTNSFNGTSNLYVYFDKPGDFQTLGQ